MSYSENQLKRLHRWAYNNEPVGWGDDGLPELPADKDGGTNGPRQVVQNLLRHLEEAERERDAALKSDKDAWVAVTRHTSTRIDETARAMLVALYGNPNHNERSKGEIAEMAYLWAKILENARVPEKKP